MTMKFYTLFENCADSGLQLGRAGFELCKPLIVTAVPLLGLHRERWRQDLRILAVRANQAAAIYRQHIPY